MPENTSPLYSIEPLPDETTEEFIQRLELTGFLAWMKRCNHPLPSNDEETHRLVSEYIIRERGLAFDRMMEECQANRKRRKKQIK